MNPKFVQACIHPETAPSSPSAGMTPMTANEIILLEIREPVPTSLASNHPFKVLDGRSHLGLLPRRPQNAGSKTNKTKKSELHSFKGCEQKKHHVAGIKPYFLTPKTRATLVLGGKRLEGTVPTHRILCGYSNFCHRD